jgi:hypothetical protein
MMQVWIKSHLDGSNNADRLLITLPDNAANLLAVNLDAEFRDMKVAIEVWVED